MWGYLFAPGRLACKPACNCEPSLTLSITLPPCGGGGGAAPPPPPPPPPRGPAGGGRGRARARGAPPPPPTTTHAAGGLLDAERSEHSVDDAPACDPASAPPGNLQRSGSGSMQPRLPPLPLADKLSAAVRALDVGSPHTANGVAQYLATSTNLRASQQRLGAATRLRSSFLQRPPAAVDDL